MKHPYIDRSVHDPQMSDTNDRKQAEQARHEAALRQIDEDRRDRLEKQTRMREAEVANSMDTEAAAQASGAPGEAAEQSVLGQEHLLEDRVESEQEGPLRRRRTVPSEPSPS